MVAVPHFFWVGGWKMCNTVEPMDCWIRGCKPPISLWKVPGFSPLAHVRKTGKLDNNCTICTKLDTRFFFKSCIVLCRFVGLPYIKHHQTQWPFRPKIPAIDCFARRWDIAQRIMDVLARRPCHWVWVFEVRKGRNDLNPMWIPSGKHTNSY